MALKTEEKLVQEALRTGALPVEMVHKHPYSKRHSHTDIVAYGPDDSVLVLVENNRVTSMGREWDRQKALEGRSRSPRGRRVGK